MIFLLTVGTAIGVSLVLPKQYTATATLVVDQSRPDPVAAAMYSGNPSPAFMATQVDVLKSDRDRAACGATSSGSPMTPKAREKWMKATDGDGSFESWLVEGLQLVARRQAVARIERDQRQLQGGGPVEGCRRGECFRAGLHGRQRSK